MKMLKNLPAQTRTSILNSWIEAIHATYPENSANFIKLGKDRFQNPMGHTISASATAIIEGLAAEREAVDLVTPIEELIKVRAIQDFTPGEAVGIFFLLKGIVRQELETEDPQQLALFDALMDRLILQAFNSYTRCREKLHQIRVDEINRRTSKLMERLDRIYARHDPERC